MRRLAFARALMRDHTPHARALRRCVCTNARIALKKSNTSTVHAAENSCVVRVLRVQSAHREERSMCWSNKQPSTSELNADCHSSKFLVKRDRRLRFKATLSCGVAPSSKSASSPTALSVLKRVHASTNAGLAAGVFFASFPSSAVSFAASASTVASRSARASLRTAGSLTEFISVSGFRADRSALRSDLRLKRISGPAAATGHPYAPMNSPRPATSWRSRVSFSTLRLTS